MTLGSFVQNAERQKIWDTTFPHMYGDLKMLTPAGVPYSSFRKIQMPFTAAVWMWILVAVAVASLLTVHRINRSRLTSWFDVINILLGGPIERVPPHNALKIALAIWMLSTLILRNAYQGAMFNFLQAQIHDDQVDTVEKVVLFNYTVYALPLVFGILNFSAPSLRSQLSISLCLNIYCALQLILAGEHISRDHFRLQLYDEDIQHFRNLRDVAFHGIYTVSHIKANYYNMLHRNNSEARVTVTKQRLAMLPIVLYLRKHSCLTAPIDVYLQRILRSGLMEHWMNMYRDFEYTRFRMARTPQILTMAQIQGIFYICAGLYALALLVLAWEIAFAKFQFFAPCHRLMGE